MKKAFIKMNEGKDYLSLGNLFNSIKKNSTNKLTSIQTEIFCSLFNINDISSKTVNNYCIGYRAISMDYKKIYYDYQKLYEEDENSLTKIVLSIVSILDEIIYTEEDDALKIINTNKRLCKVIDNLISIAKTDTSIKEEYLNKIINYYEKNDLYNAFVLILFYAILENEQPLANYETKIDIKSKELAEYLQINLQEGVSYINSLKILAKRNNMYALAELGSLEYSGLITGKVNYETCFNYYLKAAKKNHPKASWMVANLIYYKKISGYTTEFAYEYINKAIKLGSIAAINTLGNFYYNGFTLDNQKDIDKALECYNKAAELGYVYAYNNLGRYYENIDEEKALNYYKLSADNNESWALNKLGEISRKKGDYQKAFFYYQKSIEAPVLEKYYYGYYNLAKYFYLTPNEIVKEDKNKGEEYLKIALDNGITKAKEELERINNEL